jgi:hypothetical protein
MADAFKNLGQLNPGATTLTKLYTVPPLASTVASTLVICNQAAAGSFRVSVRVAGAADNPKQYLYYDCPLGANSTMAATLGICLATTDEIWVYASSTGFAFNLFGDEVA